MHTEAYHCLLYINLIRKILKNSGFVLMRLYTDFTLHCRGLYIASLYCRCFGDAGGAGESSKPLKKCAASRIKNESEMKNVCKAKKEKS
jgi:hypothetical protein